MKKLFFTEKGFTLVELIVSMVVVVILGTVIMSIFFSVLRSANKTNKLIVVRQNGNYAISQMTKLIRNAQSLSSPSSCSPSVSGLSSVTILGTGSETTTFSCVVDAGTGSTVVAAQNSVSGTSYLTDPSTTSVQASSCIFSCSQDSINRIPVIGISFILNQAGSSTGSENLVSVPFQTSVSLRNRN